MSSSAERIKHLLTFSFRSVVPWCNALHNTTNKRMVIDSCFHDEDVHSLISRLLSSVTDVTFSKRSASPPGHKSSVKSSPRCWPIRQLSQHVPETINVSFEDKLPLSDWSIFAMCRVARTRLQSFSSPSQSKAAMKYERKRVKVPPVHVPKPHWTLVGLRRRRSWLEFKG